MADLKLDVFAEWIVANGGERLAPTNQWEVLRYRTADKQTGIVWINKKGAHTLSKQVNDDYSRFLKETGLAPTEKVNRLHQDRNRKLKRQIRERDGNCCVYCGQVLTIGTLEHFHAISRGGTNHPDNCALACGSCNKIADALPVVEKIRLRDRMRESIIRHRGEADGVEKPTQGPETPAQPTRTGEAQ